MNITGKWSYNEDFEFGKSIGEVELKQSGNKLRGTFTFSEEVENEYKIEVVEKVHGVIYNEKVLLESVEVKATQNNKEINYLPNFFVVFWVSGNTLVVLTYDRVDVCGVCVIERILIKFCASV